MSSLSVGISTILCAGAVGFALLYRWVHENGIPLIGLGPHRVKLPGPAGVPFLGNLLELRDGHAKALGRWTKKYGGIFRIAIGEREAVMLSSYNAVSETLVQQGQAFQSRPEFKLWHGVFLKAVENDAPSTIGTSPMDDRINMFRRHLTAQTANVRQRRYNHFISRRMYRFVNLLADTAKSGKAEDLGFHMWTTTTGLSTEMLFGAHYDEAIIRKISEVELLIFRQRSLGQPVHDYIPMVDLYEKFLMATEKPLHGVYKALGISDKIAKFNSAEENAKRLRDIEAGYCKDLGRELHDRVEQGDVMPSQLGDLIRVYGMQLTHKDEFRVATSLVGSGMGIGTLMAWLAPKLAVEPAIQEKAYNAIKAVYGNEFPDIYDTDRVEYIKALGLEVGRYYASARLGFSRETVQDVEFNGHKIPAGTLVMLNSYWINHDPERYDSPDEFIPERWMDGHYGRMDGKAVKMGVPHLNHGAGRRFCVGIPYVNKIIYAAILLLSYNFRLERGSLDAEAMEKVYPSFRQRAEMTGEANAIEDQVSKVDPQALPLAAGIKVTARDTEGLQRWLAEAPTLLDQFDEPDLSVKAAGES